jgi:hypothetical protein
VHVRLPGTASNPNSNLNDLEMGNIDVDLCACRLQCVYLLACLWQGIDAMFNRRCPVSSVLHSVCIGAVDGA